MLPINVNLPLKSVTDRIRSSRAVLWAIETHGHRLVEILGEFFGSLLEEGEAIPFEAQLALFKKKLILIRDRLVSTDRAYRDQKASESLVRGKRDEGAAQVNSDIVGLRQAFSGIYSDAKLAEFGFARRTPQQPAELLEQASHLIVRLDSPELDLSGSSYDDFKLDAPHLARKLVRSVGSLQEADDELAGQERTSEALMLAKDDALAEYNRSFLWIARTVESLCRLAGLDEVAKRVRPSSRRPGVTQRKFDESEDSPSENSKSEDSASEGSPSEDTQSEGKVFEASAKAA